MSTPSTRDRLIETATDLFYRHGFHAIGIDRIIAEVGVTKTTFYNHFESKDDLILAVLERRDAKDIQDMIHGMAARGGDCPRRQLLSLFDLFHDWFQDPEFRGCMFMNAATEFPLHTDPVHQAAAAHTANMTEQMRLRAAAAGAKDPDRLARHLGLLVAGALVARHVAGDHDAAASAKAAAAMYLEAELASEPPDRRSNGTAVKRRTVPARAVREAPVS